jgi:3'-phosphoadenosine 5'-phosphosulfate sulfotransferase (PAPS reductase)/FAD synthetase
MILNSKIIEWGLWEKTEEYKKTITVAKNIIRKALRETTKNYGISYSGGKDSTVLLHMVKLICPDCPVIIQCDDCDWPEKLPYVESILRDYSNVHYVYPKESVLNYIKSLEDKTESICSQTHELTRDFFLNPIFDKYKELDLDGVFLGLRKEESYGRKMNAITHGHTYFNKSKNIWVSQPIAYLKVKDVFAYLVSNNIPINPCYFKNRFKPPEEIRLSWAVPTPTGLSRGEMEHIRYYYPKYFKLVKSWFS